MVNESCIPLGKRESTPVEKARTSLIERPSMKQESFISYEESQEHEPFHIVASIGGRDTVLAMLEYPVDDVPAAIRVAGTRFVREETDMAKLHYEKMPEDGTRKPAYMKYVPLVNEFAESGKESARVEDTDTPDLRPNTLAARLRTAIAHSEHGGAIKVRQRKDNVYLVLVQDMR